MSYDPIPIRNYSKLLSDSVKVTNVFLFRISDSSGIQLHNIPPHDHPRYRYLMLECDCSHERRRSRLGQCNVGNLTYYFIAH
uniref:Uncharacterized protein n=1 Tax=Pararge aegeria TaxID=116150 RepID=S4PWI3_9NEOP